MPTTLRILTTSQAPLAVPFPHPPKPALRLPPLVHRALHAALDGEPSVLLERGGRDAGGAAKDGAGDVVVIPHPDSLPRHDVPAPPADGDAADLTADDEITLRLHLAADRADGTDGDAAADVAAALDALARARGIGRADTLLIGVRGLDYRGASGGDGGDGGGGADAADGTDAARVAVAERLWAALPALAAGRVARFGTLYFPRAALAAVGRARRPVANALNTPDCQRLPADYLAYAREAGIELWAGGGGEGSDPIPAADLHNVLHEFAPVLKARLPAAPPVDALIPLTADGAAYEPVPPAVDVRWVLSYTVFSRARSVVKDKGYIVSAEY